MVWDAADLPQPHFPKTPLIPPFKKAQSPGRAHFSGGRGLGRKTTGYHNYRYYPHAGSGFVEAVTMKGRPEKEQNEGVRAITWKRQRMRETSERKKRSIWSP